MTMPLILISIFLILTSVTNLNADSGLDKYLSGTNQYQDVVVTDVISADTIRINNEEIIYLIGLKAPEPPKKKKVDRDEYGFVIKEPISAETPIGERSIAFVENLLLKKHVRLEFDVEKRNKDSRTQAYVFLLNDNTLVNAEIIRQGFAKLSLQPPNLKYENELRQAYKEAREEKRGLQGE